MINNNLNPDSRAHATMLELKTQELSALRRKVRDAKKNKVPADALKLEN